MPKPVPLRAALRVECQNIIINGPGRLADDLLMKRLSAKGRLAESVKLPIQAKAVSVFDFARCSPHDLWREQIEHAEAVVFAKETPGIPFGARGVEGQFVEWRDFDGRHCG